MRIRNTLAAGALALAAAAAVRPACAEDDDAMFLSLTRTAQPESRLPTNVSTVTGDEIRRSGALTLGDALQLLPGVDVQRTAVPGQFASVRLRGVPTANQVQVVVDDQPLGGASIQNVDIGQIPTEDIERIEVVRGASSVLYGANTIGGVIHIITKRAASAQPVSELAYEARPFQTRVYHASLEAKGKRDDGRLSVRRYLTGGFQDHSAAHALTVSGNAGHSFENGVRVAVDGYRNDSSQEDPQGTFTPLDRWDGRRERVSASTQATIDAADTRGRLHVDAPLGAGSLETLFHGLHRDYLSEDPAQGASGHFKKKENILGAEARYTVRGVTVGGSYEHDQIGVEGYNGYGAGDSAAYVEWVHRAGPLELLPAVRYDRHSAFGGTTNPRLSLVLHAAPSLDLSLNAARSFRAPDLLSLFQDIPAYLTVSNPDLQPETAWTYDAGVRVKLSTATTAQVTGFYTRYSNLITYKSNPFPTPSTYINAPQAETTGVETEVTGRTGAFSHHVSCTYQRSVRNDLTRSHYLPLAYTPRHRASWMEGWSLPRGWEVSSSLFYVDKRFELEGEQGRKLPSYTLWNLRLSKTILKAELFIAVDNVTNKRFVDVVGMSFDPGTGGFSNSWTPLPGRMVRGGITIRFTD